LKKNNYNDEDENEVNKDIFIEKRVSVNSIAVSFDEKEGIPISGDL